MLKLIRPMLGIAAAAFAAVAAPAATEPLFVPVFEEDFADPFVLVNGGEFIAYSTNRGINLPMATSRDLVNWEFVREPGNPKKLRDGMPELGAWAKTDFTWAPEVMKVGDRFILYYTARDRKRDIQCIGAAVSADPKGPFRDASATPLICQPEQGGTIDANPFRDADGKLYLYYKNDGNAVGKPTYIWGQRLSDDGVSMVGQATGLVRDDATWENKLVEAPTMVRTDAGYRLLFSAAFYGWNTERLSPYATGYAGCKGPLGPCEDSRDNPILHSFNTKQAGCLSGPGHTSVFQAGGRSFMAFHAWAATKGCRKADNKRYLYIAPISWKDGKPVLGISLRRK